MFGEIVRAVYRGKTSAKAVGVLRKTYGASLDQIGHARLRHDAIELAEYYNEHELAVAYPVELAGRLNPSDASMRTRLAHLIKLAKGVQERRLIDVEGPLKELTQVALARFGIDPSTLSPA